MLGLVMRGAGTAHSRPHVMSLIFLSGAVFLRHCSLMLYLLASKWQGNFTGYTPGCTPASTKLLVFVTSAIEKGLENSCLDSGLAGYMGKSKIRRVVI